VRFDEEESNHYSVSGNQPEESLCHIKRFFMN
jgi:hypothetical protein